MNLQNLTPAQLRAIQEAATNALNNSAVNAFDVSAVAVDRQTIVQSNLLEEEETVKIVFDNTDSQTDRVFFFGAAVCPLNGIDASYRQANGGDFGTRTGKYLAASFQDRHVVVSQITVHSELNKYREKLYYSQLPLKNTSDDETLRIPKGRALTLVNVNKDDSSDSEVRSLFVYNAKKLTFDGHRFIKMKVSALDKVEIEFTVVAREGAFIAQ